MYELRGLVILLVSLASSSALEAVLVTQDGEAKMQIVVAPTATAAERTAAEELSGYLGKATGARFRILVEGEASEAGPIIKQPNFNVDPFQHPGYPKTTPTQTW
jgi:hypothetical protein